MTARAKMQRTEERDAASARPFVVVCQKASGKEIPFDRYEEEKVARAVSSRLNEVGCEARVIDTRRRLAS